MAQSPAGSGAPSADQDRGAAPYLEAWEAVSRLLLSGQSWSGNERNCCFLNTRTGRFADASAVTGLDFLEDGRAIALVDWDFDGDLDFWLANRNAPRLRFVRNENANGNHFLAIKLQGTKSNRDAIGARLELHFPRETSEADGVPRPVIKTLRAGEGFLAQSSKWVTFGLGVRDKIDRLVVRWPDGSIEQHQPLTVDRHYTIRQGSLAEPWSPPAGRDRLAPSEPRVPPPAAQARIVVHKRTKVPVLNYQTWDGRALSLNAGATTARLVNVWASWCDPCVKELADFGDHAESLRAAGLVIVALSVDGIDDGERRDIAPARRLIELLDFPFPSGIAPRATADILERGPGLYLNRNAPLPLPSSFLLDEDGRIAVIYTGPVTSEQLLQDLKLLTASTAELLKATVPFAGRWLNTPLTIHPPASAEMSLPRRSPAVVSHGDRWVVLGLLITGVVLGLLYWRTHKRRT